MTASLDPSVDRGAPPVATRPIDDEAELWRSAWRTVWITVAMIGCLAAIVAIFDPSETTRAVMSLAAESAFTVVVLETVRRLYGGLGAFAKDVGLDAVTPRDLLNWLKGVGWQFLAVIVFASVVRVFDPQAIKQASNTTGLEHASAFALVVAGIGSICLAPLVEEIQFRVLLLKAGTMRYGFVPATILSSVIFGALHGWQVHTLAGVTVLVARMVMFGVIQCLLVRRNQRLCPNVLVHATLNAVALVAAAAT